MSFSQIISSVIAAVTGALIVKYEKDIRNTLHIKPESIKRTIIFGGVLFIIGINAGFSINVIGNKHTNDQKLLGYGRIIMENQKLKKNAALLTQKFIWEETVPDSLDNILLRTISEQCRINGGNCSDEKDRAVAFQQLALLRSLKEIATSASLFTE